MTDTNQPWAAGNPQENGSPDHEFSRNISIPDDLPPVTPPSAGMIVQLFLVPAIIVAAIVGVYALFGRMASQELDWRQLTTDVRHENPHVRWRAALGLAQMLDADAQRGAQAQRLAAKPEIAAALADLYGQLINRNAPTEEELKQIEFLSKAMGRMQTPAEILPVLRSGMELQRNHDIRKHSLIGLAMLAGTMKANGKPIEDPSLVDQVISISRESEPLFRHQAAYCLGLLPSPAAIERLEVLLEDPDEMVRVNAAIGLARNDRTAGLQVLHEVIQESIGWKLNPSGVGTTAEESTYFERMLMVLNSMKAISQLEPELTDEQRQQFIDEIEKLRESTQDKVLRTEAMELLHRLQKK